MEEHLHKALQHFKDDGFVTELEVSSIMMSNFRKEFSTLLEENGLNHHCMAVELELEWLYFFYDPEDFSTIDETKEYFKNHFKKKRSSYF